MVCFRCHRPAAPVLLQLDIMGALSYSMLTVVLTFLLVDVFDTAGTLVAVSTRAGLVGEDGKLPRLGRALLSDSTATDGRRTCGYIVDDEFY